MSGDIPWGAAFADTMLTMPWTHMKQWDSPVIRPYGPIPMLPSTSVFHYGISVFEGLKAHPTTNGHVALFRPDDHIARLNLSAQRLTLPKVPSNFVQILAAYVHHVRDWVPTSPGAALYIRILLIATSPQLGVRPSSSALLVIMASPVSSFFSRPIHTLQSGLRLIAYPQYNRAAPGGIGSCKTGGNYAASLYPASLAKSEGFDQVLWLSDPCKRFVTEVGVMNIFFVFRTPFKDQLSLVTPRIDGTFLDGITRRSVLSLATDMGINTCERNISIDEIFNAAGDGSLVQVFGTGTAAVICPISSIMCDGEVLELCAFEREDDLSVIIRRKLLSIFGDMCHPWVNVVTEPNEKDIVRMTDDPISTKQLCSW